uniref:Importin N-terminal domain-containing protein n=2 Tax=Chaetoceros debilis TaxID=122233 RepID=A0A7S3V798_9STRA|mmetsp:Transcript_10180/g.15343  ORF Transcript_10180/g.15343 Transcript_10180/m.15343 type:complete len:869 (+) Transcript_10180:140-2746(+)|eukprot:CAMPEP_0194074850 /NCGR_PEP_ID=MMETSP0149-20130528/1901_1 /TAXON_ID=122233 /ORGANISM="Chaetoceros debilis, Strain MM31A-1" /LENGTH=868 /DNA_ID=CAMNT_0038755139 /DNA_START=86 /DNA_END=2692 /DNA_ORIENTATION=+
MSDLTAILLECQNPDAAIREQAEQKLTQAQNFNYPDFALALAKELAGEEKDVTVRQLAGIHFKNLLVAKEDALQTSKHHAWMGMDAANRTAVKSILIQVIRSPVNIARHTAAQACAEVAAVEVPYNQWPEFLPAIMENITGAEHPDVVKISTLECLGFSCERIASLENVPEINPETTDKMLTAIVDGIRNDRPDPIRLSAAKALRNSLLFTKKNMENKNERDMIMTAICEATQSKCSEVRAAAYECIAQIAYQYYDKLADYMVTLFNLTTAAIESDEENVAQNAIEFWSTLCEEEMELIDEERHCQSQGIAEENPCMKYVAGALERLGPLLTVILTKQDEDCVGEDDIWNLSMAAATCLGLIANTVEDAIVPIIAPFIQNNIKSEDWRFREAATMAFSSILEGPSSETIGPYVNHSIPLLLAALSDPHEMVKDTTAWTIGRICELHVRAIPQETFPTLVNGLSEKLLTEPPQVASQACYALHNLASAFSDDDAGSTSGTNALSAYMQPLLEKLMQVVDRSDADEKNLRVAAFEAVSALIQNAAPDCKPLLKKLLPVIVERLQKSFTISFLTNEDKEHIEGVQGLLCGLIQVLVLQLEVEAVAPQGDSIMSNLLQVLQLKNATCHEEAFSAISAVCDKLEAGFVKYMDALAPFLEMGLKNFQAFHVCSIAVGLVGDIARSIESRIQPYCNLIMTALVESLRNPALHRSVKPPVLSCFGDIAMALEAGFEPYMNVSLMMLMQASQTIVPEDDEELMDFVNQLREAVLEAYTGIIQGLKDGGKTELLGPFIVHIIQFLETLGSDENKDYEVLSKAAGLLGDIASAMGRQAATLLNKPFVNQLLSEAYENGDANTQETCNWAKSVIQQAVQP